MVNLVYIYLTRIQFDYDCKPIGGAGGAIYLPGTIPQCLVNTEGNVNFSGTRSLVYRKT